MEALGAFRENVYEDLDHEWLYDPALDGIELDPAAALLGAAPMSVDDWFAPFNTGRPVHPRRGSARIADALEWKTATGRYLMTALRTAVLEVATSHDGPGPLRVLEIGAGGTVSASITRTLAAEDGLGVTVEFLCAEASDRLLRAARAGVGKRARVRFELFDLEGDSPEQELSPGSFDVIICVSALASAGDPASTARRLSGLLASGGWLLMTEPTREHYEFLISDAFLPHSAGDARAAPGGAAPSRRRWLDALAGAGMGPVLTLPDDGHPLAVLGHQLFAAGLL